MLTKEKNLPYDRTMLTKIPLKSSKSLEIWNEEFFKNYGIDVKTETEAKEIDYK